MRKQVLQFYAAAKICLRHGIALQCLKLQTQEVVAVANYFVVEKLVRFTSVIRFEV